MSESRPRRLLRVSKACDYCHHRRIKCRASQSDPHRCQNCADFDIECESSRPLKRGKAAAANRAGCLAHAATPSPADSTTEPVLQPGRYGTLNGHPNGHPNGHLNGGAVRPLPLPPVSASLLNGAVSRDRKDASLSPAWKAFAHASSPLVRKLLAVYFETVYPIFPLFDRPNVDRRLSADEQIHNRGFFCSVMAACALASARVRDGALVSLGSHTQELLTMPPETFLSAAQDTLPGDLLHSQDFDFLRACALLAIASIQDGKIDAMRMYIGHYFTMTATWQWHDEATWPPGLSPVELEERRRLYWSTYTLDIFTSIVWDGCIHFQEAHARVAYPSGDQPEPGVPRQSQPWILGWNFTTDLYRILEHAICKLRTRSSRFNLFAAGRAPDTAETIKQINDQINVMYTHLPASFKDLRAATGHLEHDIFGFQAANIQATLALLRMALLSLEKNVDLDQKCSIASDVLGIFHQVPKAFQRAISTPLIYHIGGIGNILGSVMESPMSESSYQRVRDLLLSMADLLESLESFHHQRAGAGRRLREQVERIDAYMVSRRQMVVSQQVPHEVLPMASASTENPPIGPDGISPQFQIPDELLQNWDWSFNMYQSQFPFFGDPG
ncbi:uncharacterized protein VDAG_10457 [Verticillium dahliae VdLs.17]|uniref:Zn(2)-C6 fungal-type domain-containing protein n=1 Tax=Verticillium dahliae (strain VdLs.17 / ATCC MYA-4575 / FGSC 10137) TaxID=498257 RepID=G2XJX5_VERDV|nr:uncharacterized protein VDAG_10457 [Verticillium dahliae VdLs.17]EGY21475.1 hypothetical protein VDAG_10457 [Verticillium dahliae VdLs.17]